MSGIEVAGIVLAVLPLFISATEYAEKSLQEKTIAFFHHNRVLRNLIEGFQLQQLNLRNYVENLLKHTKLTQRDITALLDDAGSAKWTDRRVVEEIDRVLGEQGRESFQYLLQKCIVPGLVNMIHKDVTARSDFSEDITDVEKLRLLRGKPETVLWNKLKFSWKIKKYEKQLENMRYCNERLCQLIDSSLRARKARGERNLSDVHAAFNLSRETSRVCEMLKKCTCQPPSGHVAAVKLSRREDTSMMTSQTEFDITCLPPKSCDLSIKVIKDGILSGNRERRYRKWKKMEDICEHVEEACSNGTCLQIVLDRDMKHYVAPDPACGVSPGAKKFVNLAYCLSKLQPGSPNGILKLKQEKLILAIILSHSILHLYNTDWSATGWHSHCIHFIQDEDAFNSLIYHPFGSLLRAPYLTARFKNEASANRAGHSSEPIVKQGIKEPSIFALGVLLLEIHLGYPIYPDLMNSSDPRAGALHKLDSCESEMKDDYYEATSFCLVPKRRVVSIQDHEFRESYYEEVIARLTEEAKKYYGIDDTFWTDA